MHWLSRIAAQAICAVVFMGSGVAGADDSVITLAQAMARARANHPALAEGEAALRAQDARIAEAALTPQASAELLVEDAGGTGERRGFSAAQTTLSLSHLIERGGKREGRVAVAEAERSMLKTAQEARRLDIGAEVARRFIDTLRAQAQAEVTAEAMSAAERTHAAVDKRVRGAQALPAEAARARVALELAKLEQESTEHELKGARQYLAAAMGERQVRFGRSAGALLEFGATLPFEALEPRIEASPDFTRFADEARVRDAQVRLAQLRQRSDVRTQIGVRRYGESGDTALMAGFSIPIGSARRAASAIEVARAERSQLDAQRQVAFLGVRAQLFDQYQELEHARHEAQVLHDTVVPQLIEALQKSEYAYQRGRYSYLEWSEVQRELLAARRRLNDVAAAFHTLRIEIERLSGEPVALTGESR